MKIGTNIQSMVQIFDSKTLREREFLNTEISIVVLTTICGVLYGWQSENS